MSFTQTFFRWNRTAVLVASSALMISQFATPASGQQRRPADCCRPAPAAAAPAAAAPAAPRPATPPVAAPAQRPVMFAAPTPTGEIAGARNSIALPSLKISLPKLSIETPELRLSGFTRFRREAEMQIDGTAAAASHMNPLLMGQLTGAGIQQPTAAPARPAAAPAQPQPQPAAAAPAAPPSEGCCEGCYSSVEQQKVLELKQQILQLQSVVAELNARQAQAQQQIVAAQSTASAAQGTPATELPPQQAQLRDEQPAARQPTVTQVAAQSAQPSPEVIALQQQVQVLTASCQQLIEHQQQQQPAGLQSPVRLVSQQSVQDDSYQSLAANRQQASQQTSDSRTSAQVAAHSPSAPPPSQIVSQPDPSMEEAEGVHQASGWRRFLPWKRK